MASDNGVLAKQLIPDYSLGWLGAMAAARQILPEMNMSMTIGKLE